jgi:hypothetical protein
MVPQSNTPYTHPFTRQVTISIIHQQATCQSLADPFSLIDIIGNNADCVHDACFGEDRAGSIKYPALIREDFIVRSHELNPVCTGKRRSFRNGKEPLLG